MTSGRFVTDSNAVDTDLYPELFFKEPVSRSTCNAATVNSCRSLSSVRSRLRWVKNAAQKHDLSPEPNGTPEELCSGTGPAAAQFRPGLSRRRVARPVLLRPIPRLAGGAAGAADFRERASECGIGRPLKPAADRSFSETMCPGRVNIGPPLTDDAALALLSSHCWGEPVFGRIAARGQADHSQAGR